MSRPITLNEKPAEAMIPGVNELIAEVTRICNNANKSLSLCLDLEPRYEMLVELLRLGVRAFCVSPLDWTNQHKFLRSAHDRTDTQDSDTYV